MAIIWKCVRPPTVPAPQSTSAALHSTPLSTSARPGSDYTESSGGLSQYQLFLSRWRPVSVGRWPPESLLGRAKSRLLSPEESLRGLPLLGASRGLHLGRSPGRKRLPPRGLPVLCTDSTVTGRVCPPLPAITFICATQGALSSSQAFPPEDPARPEAVQGCWARHTARCLCQPHSLLPQP